VPSGPRSGIARALSVSVLVGALAVVLAVVLSSGSTYRIHAVFQDAGQLVKGDRVLVGGITIGKVTTITLDDHSRADVTLTITDKAFDPLHDGTRASIGSPSLSTEASRYVSLQPGVNSNPKLGSGSVIGTDRTEGIVDLDALFNTLDYETRSRLQQIVHGSAIQYGGGQAAAANRGLEYLSPALSQTQLLTGELVRDERAFEDFIVSSASVVSAIEPRDADLRDGITNAAALTERLAQSDKTIGELLDRAPPVLHQATGTLRDVDRALGDARPALRAAQPVAPRLARVLELAAPVSRHARPAIAGLAALLPDVRHALEGLPKLGSVGGKALDDATSTLHGAAPIVAEARPYVPDVVGGLINGFGGNVGAYYDANGRYARIAFELPPNFLVQGGSVLSPPIAALLNGGLGNGLFVHPPNYCPGGSTIPPADKSAPFLDDSVSGHCDPAETPKP
jgi:phospholipid/cholesterol/gamma-HCH transport system substrate-binding protein